jgi:hypothetical protein
MVMADARVTGGRPRGRCIIELHNVQALPPSPDKVEPMRALFREMSNPELFWIVSEIAQVLKARAVTLT